MRETKELCLTKKEKRIFILLGIIIVIVTGILIVQTFSQNERTLETVYPVTTIVSNVETNYDDKKSAYSSVSLKEENTDKAQLAYVTKLESSKQTQELAYSSTGGTTTPKNNLEIKETQPTKENITAKDTSILGAWDFPSDIIIQAEPNTTIKINNQIKLNNGETATALVTIRKLVNDIYMIEKIKNNKLTLTEGIYKYYYTYGNVTKEKELIVKNNLKISSVKIPDVHQSNNEQDENNTEKLQEITKNSIVNFNDKIITLRIDENNIKTEIPLYLEIDKEQMAAIINQQNNNVNQEAPKQTIIMTDTYGIILDTTISNNYESLNDNELVMWINLEILSTTGLIDVSFNINDNTYHIKIDITYLNNQSKSEDNNQNNDDLDIINNLEKADALLAKQNNNSLRDNQTSQNNNNQLKPNNEKDISTENKDIIKINKNNNNQNNNNKNNNNSRNKLSHNINNLSRKKRYSQIKIKNTITKELSIKDKKNKESQDEESYNNLSVINSQKELLYQTQDTLKSSDSNEVSHLEKVNNLFKENLSVENLLFKLNKQNKVYKEDQVKEKTKNSQSIKEDIVSVHNNNYQNNLSDNKIVIINKEINNQDNNIIFDNNTNNEYKQTEVSLDNIDEGYSLENLANHNPKNKLRVKT